MIIIKREYKAEILIIDLYAGERELTNEELIEIYSEYLVSNEPGLSFVLKTIEEIQPIIENKS